MAQAVNSKLRTALQAEVSEKNETSKGLSGKKGEHTPWRSQSKKKKVYKFWLLRLILYVNFRCIGIKFYTLGDGHGLGVRKKLRVNIPPHPNTYRISYELSVLLPKLVFE